MEQEVLKATVRTETGKKVSALRRAGQLPAVIYGKALKAPIAVSLDLREATRVLRHVGSSTLLTLEVEGREIPTLVRERQRDFLRGDFLHVDFLAISLTEKVRTEVSIVLDGVSQAVKDGGLLITGVESVEVEALPQDLPENFTVDLSVLKAIGDGIHVSDLIMPAGVECLSDPEELIAVVTAPTIEVVEEVEPTEVVAELEPEIIEKGKAQEESEEGED
ncbi:MAG: 50S ribosomal protein L25 [Chloroflexi bacterium]|nr:50S ribosomal protein L25 [Chloroflexota bacterium]